MSHSWSNLRGYGYLHFGTSCGAPRTPHPWNRLEPLTDANRNETYLNYRSVDFTRTPAVHAAVYGTCEPCRPQMSEMCPTPTTERVMHCSPVSGMNTPPRAQCWYQT